MDILDLRRKSSIVYLILAGIGLVGLLTGLVVFGLAEHRKLALVLALVPFFFASLALKRAERLHLILLVVSLGFSARYRPFGGAFHTGGAELAIAPLDFPLLGLLLLGLPDILKGFWRRLKADFKPLALALVVFFLAHAANILVAADRWLAALEFLRLVKMVLLMAVLLWYLRTRPDVLLVAKVLLVTVVAQGLLAVAQWLTGASFGLGFLGEHSFWTIEQEFTTIGRAGGTMGHANALAHFFEVLAPLALALAMVRSASLKFRALAVTAVLAGLAGTFVTFSRAGWVALLIGFICALLLRMRRRVFTLQAVNVILLLTLVVGIVGLVFADLIVVRLGNFGGTSWAFRKVTFRVALNAWSMKPLLGIGANSYQTSITPYIPDGLSPWSLERADSIAHNIVLLYGAEMGIVGVVALLALLFAVARLAWRVVRLDDAYMSAVASGLLAGIVALFVHSQLGWLFRYDPVFTLFWFVVGLLLAAYHVLTQVRGEASPAQGTQPDSERTSGMHASMF